MIFFFLLENTAMISELLLASHEVLSIQSNQNETPAAAKAAELSFEMMHTHTAIGKQVLSFLPRGKQ